MGVGAAEALGRGLDVEGLAECLPANLFVDFPLCVSATLALSDPKGIDQLVDKLAETFGAGDDAPHSDMGHPELDQSARCMLGLVCYSVRLLHATEDGDDTSYLVWPVDKIKLEALTRAESMLDTDDASFLAGRVKYFNSMLGSAEVQSLSDKLGIDETRFREEKDYRDSEILRALRADQMAKLCELAQRLGTSVWDVHAQHLQVCLLGEITASSEDVHANFPSLLAKPDGLRQLLEAAVLPRLSNTDLRNRCVCYELLAECDRIQGVESDTFEAASTQLQNLQALLRTPESFREDLDPLHLAGVMEGGQVDARDVLPQTVTINVLRSRVSKDNISEVAGALDGVFRLAWNSYVDGGLLYLAVAVSEFTRSAQNDTLSDDWPIQQQILGPCDITQIASFGLDYVVNATVSIGTRVQVLTDIARDADMKLMAAVESNASNVKETDLLRELKQKLQFLSSLTRLLASGDLAEDGCSAVVWLDQFENCDINIESLRDRIVFIAGLGCPETVVGQLCKMLNDLYRKDGATGDTSESGSIYSKAVDRLLCEFSAFEPAAQAAALTDYIRKVYDIVAVSTASTASSGAPAGLSEILCAVGAGVAPMDAQELWPSTPEGVVSCLADRVAPAIQTAESAAVVSDVLTAVCSEGGAGTAHHTATAALLTLRRLPVVQPPAPPAQVIQQEVNLTQGVLDLFGMPVPAVGPSADWTALSAKVASGDAEAQRTVVETIVLEATGKSKSIRECVCLMLLWRERAGTLANAPEAAQLWAETLASAICLGSRKLINEIVRPRTFDFLRDCFGVAVGEAEVGNMMELLRNRRGFGVESAELGIFSDHSSLRDRAVVVLAELQSPPRRDQILWSTLVRRPEKPELWKSPPSFLPLFLLHVITWRIH